MKKKSITFLLVLCIAMSTFATAVFARSTSADFGSGTGRAHAYLVCYEALVEATTTPEYKGTPCVTQVFGYNKQGREVCNGNSTTYACATGLNLNKGVSVHSCDGMAHTLSVYL